MNRKRGALAIVEVTILLLIVYNSLGNEEDVSTLQPLEEAEKIAELHVSTSDADDPFEGCSESTISVTIRPELNQMSCESTWVSHSDGCSFSSEQSCYDCEDDSNCAGVKRSALITMTGKKVWGLNWGGYADCISSKGYKSSDGNQYLCSDDNWWKKCSSGDEGKITWANDILYKCVIHEGTGLPTWEETAGTDLDKDGITTSTGDCDDNPQDDPSLCSGIESIDDCSNLKYSPCAICIHPNAAETCGDGTDNDCSSTTSDECNKFKEGCEQTALPASEDPDSEQYLGEQKISLVNLSPGH